VTAPLHWLTIEEAARLLGRRELTSVDLVSAHIERIARIQPKLNAFITITADSALEAARRADVEISAGRYRGPLHGIPIAHKDLVATRGVKTTAHSGLLRDWIPQEDAHVYALLEKAGAISLGKTALHEFAFGSPGQDEAFPAARNPWNIDHMPGSSSSGSGAGVAAGLFMGATGTDTGGSVRHPAAVCGVVGAKPTYGRVSCHGVLPLAKSFDTVGPIARTVLDAALMLQPMAGHDARDSNSADEPVPDFRSLIGQAIRGQRIGIPRRFIASIEHTSEILKAFEEAERVFRSLGAELVDVLPDGLEESHDAGSLIITYEAYQYHKANLAQRPEAFAENFRARFVKAPAITEENYRDAMAKVKRVRDSVQQLFAAGVSAIVNPGRERPAQTMLELISEPLGKRSLALRMFSVTGNPALVLPMGFSNAELPLGMQVAAAHFREDVLFQIGHAFETATPWHRRHPEL
jgi:aspartyl-tRNA(Asn)/glutamyl-tRNA(Gln) amidotransferase subunit A